MNCKQCKDKIALFVIGELADDEAARLKEHLEGCPECRGEYDELVAVVRAFEHFRTQDLTDSEKLKLESNIYRHMAAAGQEAAYRMPKPISLLLRVAAAVLIFVAGYSTKTLLVDPSGGRPSTSEIAELPADITRYELASIAGHRFSAEGLKVIARGKAALPQGSISIDR
ncbi:MAG: zf-HC2 domain-containing protein [Candidatus Zixiibacteriota bacterium]|nr:MAG: zf-HC2 domain-containing protein [candidate division Zixibacteria bacterium]